MTIINSDHTCRCGAVADAEGIYGLVCKQAPSRIARHHAINYVIVHVISSSSIPVTKEPVSLTRLDSKRPDGLTLTPWHGGKLLTWDVISILADSYLHAMSHSAGGTAAETASSRKVLKYSSIPTDYISQPVAFETQGSFDASSFDFLCEVGRHLTAFSGDLRVTSFLFQRLSVLIQRFSSVLTLESFISTDEDPDL